MYGIASAPHAIAAARTMLALLTRSGSAAAWTLPVLALLLLTAAPAAAQLVVDDDAELPDFDLSDGICQVCYETDDDGNCTQAGGCSLIAAIQNANQSPDFDVITFALPLVPNITRDSPLDLPAITTPVRIDGAVGDGRVHIQGPFPARDTPGLLFDGPGSAGSEVVNVEISRSRTGIEFRNSPGGIVRNCVIQDNNAAGIGIAVVGASEGALIGGSTDLDAGNVIVGNGRGIVLTGSGGHKVYGNRIGIDADGNANGNATGIVVGAGAGVGTQIGSGEAVHRNVIANNTNAGIAVTGTSALGESRNVRLLRIYGNYIGTDPTGTVAAPNGWGIELTRTDSIRIGRGSWGDPRGNLIAGNGIEGNAFPWAGTGVYLNNRNTYTFVYGNTIGMGADDGRLANADGVVVRGRAQDVEIGQNWIAGNNGHGVVLTRVNTFAPEGNRVLQNYIGIEPDADMEVSNEALFNGAHGVLIEEAGFNQVAANEIGNSGGDGIRLVGDSTSENSIEGNDIGLKPAGPRIGLRFFARPNGGDGVAILGGSNNLVDDNWVASSEVGIRLVSADLNSITRNVLGASSASARLHGTTVVRSGNRVSAVLLDGGADDNDIGSPGEGNVCLDNPQCIVVLEGTGNVMRDNFISTSQLEPLDLGGDGLDANDPFDIDTGPNLRQNAPSVIDARVEDGEATYVVEGRLIAAPSTTYVIEAFLSSSRSLPNALRTLGTVEVTTGAEGTATWALSAALDAPTRPGDWASATATDPGGNTSELVTQADDTSALPRLVLQAPPVAGLPDPEETGEFVVPIDVSNLGFERATDVELELSTDARFELDRVEVDDDAPICVDTVPIACSLGDLEGRTWVSPVVYGSVAAEALGKGAADVEVRIRASATIDGERVQTGEVVIQGAAPVANEAPPVLTARALAPPYPTPFREQTTLRYVHLPGASAAAVVVFDVLGRRLRTLPGPRVPGEHAVVWDGRDAAGRRVAAGVYFIGLRVDGRVAPVYPIVFRP